MQRFPMLLVVALLACGACATHPQLGSESAWAGDREAIADAIQQSAGAWNRGDLKGHLSFYADSVTFMTANGPRVGRDAIEASFAASYFQGGRPRQSLRFEQLSIARIGSGGALATGRFVLSGGGEPEQSGWFTLVWERTPAGWRAVHDHSS